MGRGGIKRRKPRRQAPSRPDRRLNAQAVVLLAVALLIFVVPFYLILRSF
jgi:hypothetical protein